MEKALQSCVIVGSIAKQKLQVMGKRVEQFDDRLVVVAAGSSEQEAHDQASQADHTVQLVAKVLEGFAATDPIVSRADNITARFASLVADAGNRSRVNDGCLF